MIMDFHTHQCLRVVFFNSLGRGRGILNKNNSLKVKNQLLYKPHSSFADSSLCNLLAFAVTLPA